MNDLEVLVIDFNDRYIFRYEYKDDTYDIEVPKTVNNNHLHEGDIIKVIMGILVTNESQLD